MPPQANLIAALSAGFELGEGGVKALKRIPRTVSKRLATLAALALKLFFALGLRD